MKLGVSSKNYKKFHILYSENNFEYLPEISSIFVDFYDATHISPNIGPEKGETQVII